MKFMNRNKKGFTLVELMIVVVIMAILVAVAVPIYGAVTDNTKHRTCTTHARNLSSQMSQVMSGVIDNTDPVTTLKAGVTFSDATTVADCKGGTSTALIAGLLQDGMPVCPCSGDGDDEVEYFYVLQSNGQVLCSGTYGDGEGQTAVTGDAEEGDHIEIY